MMQRAIPRGRAILALLATVAAVATTPLAGATSSAHDASKPVKQYYLCPPVC